jgi:hypothetical protein
MPLDIFLILSCGVCSNRACTLSEKIAYHVISISKPRSGFKTFDQVQSQGGPRDSNRGICLIFRVLNPSANTEIGPEGRF